MSAPEDGIARVDLPDSFSIGEAAAIVGIPQHTIRAWERRHNLLEPRRTATNQRRYTVEDLRVLARRAGARSRTGAEAGEVALVDQSVWRFIADRLADLILIVDLDGRTVDVNEAVARATGVPRGRLLKRPFHLLAEPDDRGRAAAVTAGAPRRGVAVRLRAERSSGGVFRFDCCPVRHGDERLLVLIGRPAPTR